MRIDTSLRRAALAVGVASLLLAAGAAAQEGQSVDIPANATLEGVPTEREESSATATERIALSAQEAEAEGLLISVENGRISWASRGGEPLELRTGDGFTYLTSTRTPGEYIQITRFNDRIAYVEHLDTAAGHVIYRGELSIRLGR